MGALASLVVMSAPFNPSGKARANHSDHVQARPAGGHVDAPQQALPPSALARKRARRLRRTWLERMVVAAGVVASTLAFMAAGVVAWGLDKYQAIDRIELDLGGSNDAATSALPEAGEPRNWLLVGSDSREGINADDPHAEIFLGEPEAIAGKRTDSMIIARVDPATRSVDLLSIPRDLYVPIAGTSRSTRINSAFNGEGGEQRLVDTIEEYFDIPIHHYVEINFVGFQDVVDALGGVPIWFDQPMRDAGSGLDVVAGCHILDGFQALAFARGRNVEFFSDGHWQKDGTGDLGRTSRQQYFISRVANAAASQIDVTSLPTINRLLDVGGENLSLDQAASAEELLGLASLFATVEEGQVRGHALPVYDFRSPSNAAVLGVQAAEAKPILDVFRGLVPTANDGDTPVNPETLAYSVEIFNGSRVVGQASQTADALRAAGFSVGAPDNAETSSSTRIVYGPGAEAGAIELARYVDAEVVFVADPTATGVALITGTDFNGILTSPKTVDTIDAPTTTVPVPAEAAPATTVAPIGVVPGPSPEGTQCG